jgi:tRNA (cytidine32/uridine32-2'-O)-methyltransferase
MNKNIRIILVNTSHPGNIGATARAMKNMGFERLYLVSPESFPHPDAKARAVGADNLLEQAVVTTTLDEALRDCTLVFGTSARMRFLPQEMLTPRQAAEKIVNEFIDQDIAIVFGNEKFGLSNEELKRCHYHICIPTDPHFSSLNLAMAVQIVVYELFMKTLQDEGRSYLHERGDFATFEDLEGLYRHLEEVVTQIDFLDPQNPRRMMIRFRQILGRARLDKNELNLFRGMLTGVQHKVIEKDFNPVKGG